jgi:hypothetical protein
VQHGVTNAKQAPGSIAAGGSLEEGLGGQLQNNSGCILKDTVFKNIDMFLSDFPPNSFVAIPKYVVHGFLCLPVLTQTHEDFLSGEPESRASFCQDGGPVFKAVAISHWVAIPRFSPRAQERGSDPLR